MREKRRNDLERYRRAGKGEEEMRERKRENLTHSPCCQPVCN